jgi:hypothetical protein
MNGEEQDAPVRSAAAEQWLYPRTSHFNTPCSAFGIQNRQLILLFLDVTESEF